MKENKILDFVSSFNRSLGETDRYFQMEMIDNGTVTAVSIPTVHIFDDENDSTEYVEEVALGRVVTLFSHVLKIAKKEFKKKVAKFVSNIQNSEKFQKINVIYKIKDADLYLEVLCSEDDVDEIYEYLDNMVSEYSYMFGDASMHIYYNTIED